jgi:hypothetical protein
VSVLPRTALRAPGKRRGNHKAGKNGKHPSYSQNDFIKRALIFGEVGGIALFGETDTVDSDEKPYSHPRPAAALELFAAAARARRIFAQIDGRADFAERFDHAVQIKPAAFLLNEPAHLMQDALFTVFPIISFEFDEPFVVLRPALFCIDDFQTLPYRSLAGEIDIFRTFAAIPGSAQIIGITLRIGGEARAHQGFGCGRRCL